MTGRLSFADVASASAKASPPTARTSQEPPPTTGESLDDNKASKSTDAKDTTGAVSESPNWRALGWTNGSQRKVVHHHGKPGYPHLTNFDEKSRFGRVFSVISRKIGIAWPRSCIETRKHLFYEEVTEFLKETEESRALLKATLAQPEPARSRGLRSITAKSFEAVQEQIDAGLPVRYVSFKSIRIFVWLVPDTNGTYMWICNGKRRMKLHSILAAILVQLHELGDDIEGGRVEERSDWNRVPLKEMPTTETRLDPEWWREKVEKEKKQAELEPPVQWAEHNHTLIIGPHGQEWLPKPQDGAEIIKNDTTFFAERTTDSASLHDCTLSIYNKRVSCPPDHCNPLRILTAPINNYNRDMYCWDIEDRLPGLHVASDIDQCNNWFTRGALPEGHPKDFTEDELFPWLSQEEQSYLVYQFNQMTSRLFITDAVKSALLPLLESEKACEWLPKSSSLGEHYRDPAPNTTNACLTSIVVKGDRFSTWLIHTHLKIPGVPGHAIPPIRMFYSNKRFLSARQMAVVIRQWLAEEEMAGLDGQKKFMLWHNKNFNLKAGVTWEATNQLWGGEPPKELVEHWVKDEAVTIKANTNFAGCAPRVGPGDDVNTDCNAWDKKSAFEKWLAEAKAKAKAQNGTQTETQQNDQVRNQQKGKVDKQQVGKEQDLIKSELGVQHDVESRSHQGSRQHKRSHESSHHAYVEVQEVAEGDVTNTNRNVPKKNASAFGIGIDVAVVDDEEVGSDSDPGLF